MSGEEAWSTRRALTRGVAMGISVGVLVALAEICWTYNLPVVFPGRLYVLPESMGSFLAIALLVDVPLWTAAIVALALGLRLAVAVAPGFFGRMRPQVTFDALALFAAAAYLGVGLPYTYYIVSLKSMGSVTWGLLLVAAAVLCLAVAYALDRTRARFGAAASAGALAIAVAGLAVAIGAAHSRVLETANEAALPDAPQARADSPDVVLVTLDTVGAQFLPLYGNPVVRTPALESLAADGIVFDRAFAQAPLTCPSHGSIMTSTYPVQHGGMNGSAMTANFPTLAQILQTSGYSTAAFVSSNILRSGNSGLNRGFDYYEDSISPYLPVLRHDSLQYLLAVYLLAWAQDNQIPGRYVTDRGLGWLERHRDQRIFLWLHYYDSHEPVGDVPPPYRTMYVGKFDPALPSASQRELYAGDISYTDSELGRVLEGLKELGRYRDSLIVVTADHGEAFRDMHGNIFEDGHGSHVYDTTQHVPLVVKLPGNRHAGERVSRVVQTVDVAPTVLAVVAAPRPESFRGLSLLASLEGDEREHAAYLEARDNTRRLPDLGVAALAPRRYVAMRIDDRKYIFDLIGDENQVYDMASDPGETRNLVGQVDPSELELIRQHVLQTLGDPAAEGPSAVDPRVAEQLRALGYME